MNSILLDEPTNTTEERLTEDIAPQDATRETATKEQSPLGELESTLKASFFEPDIQAIRIVLGTIRAHLLKLGDPAWLFVVAPPGSGKTTMSIMGASGLPDVRMLGDFSENTFLSGFYGHQTPGMLEKLGHTVQEGQTFISSGDAILMAKDFTTVITMRREKRAAILSQLREIHDGQFKRDFGTGVTKIWRGRVTVIAAVTPVLDRHYGIFSVLGERFMQIRWHRPKSEEAGVWAIRQQGNEQQFQETMRNIIGRVLRVATKLAPTLTDAKKLRIASLGEIVALGRTHVYRSSFGNREIEYVPESEANTRISKGLAAIAKGVASLRGHQEVAEDDLQDAFRVGLDSLSDYRRRLFLAVARGLDPKSVGLPKTMCVREFEELVGLGLVKAESPLGYQLVERITRLWKKADVK